MKKKGNFRKVVSGLLAGMTMLSTVLSPMTAYAAEIQPEEKPPLYEEVKDLLCFLKCDFDLVIILDFQSRVI